LKNDAILSFFFIKFLESNQEFFIKIEVVNKDGLLCCVIDIILVSILMKILASLQEI